MAKNYNVKIKLDAMPDEVYSALTNPFAIELWSGAPAQMSTEAGSEFELWEGDIAGQNLEFVENEKIVQKWYFGDVEPESIVTFRIYPRGASKSMLQIDHTNIPDEDYDDIVAGWEEVYIAPLKSFLEDED